MDHITNTIGYCQLRLVRQVVDVFMAKSFMSIKQPQPWLNVASSNVYYLVFLGMAFKQSDGYLTIPFMAALNVSIKAGCAPGGTQ